MRCGSGPRAQSAGVWVGTLIPHQTLPPDLQQLLQQLAAVDKRAERVMRGLSEAQFNWQPVQGTGWSIAQCLDHLNAANSIYLNAMREAIEEARRWSPGWGGPVRPGLWARLYLWNLEPPPRLRLKAPARTVPPVRLDRLQIWTEFVHVEWRVTQALQQCGTIDLNRTRFPNPFLRGMQFTLGTGFLAMLAHNRRHIWQAERVRESLPGSAAAAVAASALSHA